MGLVCAARRSNHRTHRGAPTPHAIAVTPDANPVAVSALSQETRSQGAFGGCGGVIPASRRSNPTHQSEPWFCSLNRQAVRVGKWAEHGESARTKVPVRWCSQRVQLPSRLGYLRKQMPGRCCHRNTLIAAMRHRQHAKSVSVGTRRTDPRTRGKDRRGCEERSGKGQGESQGQTGGQVQLGAEVPANRWKQCCALRTGVSLRCFVPRKVR